MAAFLADTVPLVVALLAILVALALPPAQLAARCLLRAWVGPAVSRAHAPSVVVGFGAGAGFASLWAGSALGPQAALFVALLVLLVLLATIDVAWRWLPLEWCGLIAVLSGANAVLTGGYTTAALGALAGGGLLFVLRGSYLLARGVEGLGLGDVWLAAALGVFVGPFHIIWLLGAAAGLGLLLHFLSPSLMRARIGVAFGAHICVVTPFFLVL